MNNAHVLLLEDDPLWVETVRDVVAPHVQRFYGASSLAEAEKLIDKAFCTVAIVDISLVGGDPKDSQGMRFLRMLAERGLGTVVSAIVLSAYGDMERQRAAFRDYHVVDFLSKAPFSPQELIGAVERALAAHQRLAPLTIELASSQPMASLWSRFEWPQREEAGELAHELTDLLRRLFPGATDLFLQPIRTGQSGAGVVKAEPIYGAKRGASLIVKFGKRDKIEAEHKNYDEYIERFISYQASTQLGFVTGRVMGAIAYSLVGAELSEATSFADFYAGASLDALQRTLDNLFQRTCSRWYENREQPRRTRDLVALYRQGLHIHQWDEIWQGMADVQPDVDAPRLAFPGVNGAFRNPKHWLTTHDETFYLPVWLATTHGDLNEHNILVTNDHRTWLIDFYRTGPGHILRDIVELECAIKFNLAGIVDLPEQHRFEAALLAQTRLDRGAEIPPAAPFAKPMAVINHLREFAADFSGSSMQEYNVALLLHTLYMLSLKFLYETQVAHRDRVLVSAAMLADAL